MNKALHSLDLPHIFPAARDYWRPWAAGLAISQLAVNLTFVCNIKYSLKIDNIHNVLPSVVLARTTLTWIVRKTAGEFIPSHVSASRVYDLLKKSMSTSQPPADPACIFMH